VILADTLQYQQKFEGLVMVFQKLLPIFVGHEFVSLSGRRAIFPCVVSVDGDKDIVVVAEVLFRYQYVSKLFSGGDDGVWAVGDKLFC
jgi:hypothetical protein